MGIFSWKQKLSVVRQLVNLVSKTKIDLTFELNNKGYVYRILSEEQANQWTEGFKKFYSNRKQEFVYRCDLDSVFVFAQIINHGDNEYGLFEDSEGQIYHTDNERGCNDGPWTSAVAKNLTVLTGVIDPNAITSSHHFAFSKPIVRIAELVDSNRAIRIDTHGFYIDDYEKRLKELILANSQPIELTDFKYQEIQQPENSNAFHISLKINNRPFSMNLTQTKWFEQDFIRHFNSFLENLDLNVRLCLVMEEDWHDYPALIFLNDVELKLFKENRIAK